MWWRVDSWRQLRSEESRELKSVGNNRRLSCHKKGAVKIQRWQAQARSKDSAKQRRDWNVGEKKTPGETEGSRKGCQDSKTRKIQKCQGQRLPRDDKRKPDQEKVASLGRDVKEKKCQGEKMSRQAASKRKVCEDAETSGANQIKRQWQHETKMLRNQKRQGQRLPRDHGDHSRASQAVRRCSCRLSLVFIGSSLSRNFRHPACPGSTCITSNELKKIVRHHATSYYKQYTITLSSITQYHIVQQIT